MHPPPAGGEHLPVLIGGAGLLRVLLVHIVNSVQGVVEEEDREDDRQSDSQVEKHVREKDAVVVLARAELHRCVQLTVLDRFLAIG